MTGTSRVRRSLPFLASAILLLATGLGAGLGLSEAPSVRHVNVTVPSLRSAPTNNGSSALARTAQSPGFESPTSTMLDTAVVGGRFVAPVTLGGLTVDPAPVGSPATPLGLDQARAAAYAGYTDGLGGTPTIGFGLVSVRGARAPNGTPTLAKTPAWVGIVLGVNDRALFCPAERSGTPTMAPFRPEDRVAIFYGETGRGAVLYDTGGTRPCGGPPLPPSLAVANAMVPVRWQQQGTAGLTTTITYQAPRCSRLGSVGSSGNVHTGVYSVEVTVGVPFARTGCDAVRTFTTTVSVYPPDAGPGAPPPPVSVVLVPSTAPDAVPPALVGPTPH